MERQWDVPFPGLSCLCYEESPYQPEIWVRIICCLWISEMTTLCSLWRWVGSNSKNIKLFMSLQWLWVIVSEHFTTLTLCLLSCGNSPGFRTSSCATTRPECPSGSWWRRRWTIQVLWKRRMWSRLSGSRTVALKPVMQSFVFCVLASLFCWNNELAVPQSHQ